MERTRSPITTETDIDLTAALLPSGGTRSHHHAVKTAVSETGPPPDPGRLALSSPAGCQLWNAPYPTRPAGSCPGKGFVQSTQPFSFGTRAVPPRHEPRLTLHPGELPAAASWLGGDGDLKELYLERWGGPETRPGLDTGSAPPSAFQKPPIWDGCTPWAEAWLCPVKLGRDASPPEVGCGLRAEQGCAGVGLPGGSRGESAGQRGDPVAAETAAEPRRDSGCALSKAPEQPATGREGAQDVPLPVGAVHLQNSAPAVVGSRQSRCAPSEPDPRGEELPPGRTEEEGQARRLRVTEPGRRSGARSSAGPDCESGEAAPPELASHTRRAGSQEPAGASSPTKTSVEDAYGSLTKACGLSLLEELRRTFLDADGGCFSLLDSGLVLGRAEEHAALGLALLRVRDGRKLATALPNSSLFLYYALGRQFYVTEKLADRWFRARDRVTGESMLVKKVPVVSDWRKMLRNFLFLPPHPSLLVPYAVLYDRNGSILYLMQDRDVRAVGRPPEGPGVETARALQEALSFLRYCKQHGFHPGDVGAACIYTAQGVCFDPSSLSSSEGPCAFRKSVKTCLRSLLARHQEHASLDALVESMCQDLEEEESPGHSDPPSSQAPGAGLK